MSALRDFQTSFKGYLTGSGEEEAAVAARFISSGFADNASIYRNNVRHAHVGALSAIYPAIRALVGEDYFDGLAARYANARPPVSAVLAGYGAGFSKYLTSRSELSRVPFLPDVARLEWAMNEAFHAHSSFSLAPDEVAQLFAGSAVDFDLVASARLLVLDHAALEIRAAALEGDAETIAALATAGQRLIVFRVDGAVTAEPLSPGEHAFLRRLSGGFPLDRAIAAAFELESEFIPAEAIGRLLHLGVFAAPAYPNGGN